MIEGKDLAPTQGSAGLIPVKHEGIPSRMITKDAAKSHGAGVGQWMGSPCQVFTYCDKAGHPVAQKLKFKGKKFTIVGNAKQMGLWQQHRWSKGKNLLICEGETDLLCWQSINAGKDWPAVSLPNGADPKAKAIRENLEWLKGFENIVLCFDNDEAGARCTKAALKVLPPGKVKVMRIPGGHNDICEAAQAGLQSELRDAFWNAQPDRPDDIVGTKEILESLRDFKVTGTPTPWPGLNEKTMGLREGELVTVTAGTGIGKSHMCRVLAVDLIKKGHKIGYISLEESLARTGLGFLEQIIGKPLHLEGELDEDEITKAWMENLDGKVSVFNHFGSLDAENLMTRVQHMKVVEGCDYVFLDHLSILVSGWDSSSGDERRLIDNVMTALRSIVAATGVGMILVSHLRRGDNKSKSHEEGGRPKLSDLRGSQAIAQLSDTVIGLCRDQQGDNPNLSEVWVLKCRYTGLTGKAGTLKYHPDTGAMTEQEEDADVYFAD